jgi:hypothetical protein
MRRRFLFVFLPSLVIAAVLAVGSDAPANAPDGRFVTVADGIQDQITGLTWQQSDDGTTYTMANAATHCTSLGGTWRLPAMNELMTIVDPRAASPSLDPAFTFTSTGGYVYWTSTWGSCAGMPMGIAYAVDFSTGASSQTNTTTTYRARCVH